LIGRITSLAFSPDDNSLFAADGAVTKSGVIRVWETKDWKLKSSWEAHRDAIMALDVSHDGKYLATAGTDNLAKIWSLSNQVEIAKFERHMGHVLGAGFSPDDSMLATVGADKVLNLWDTKTREQKITLTKHPAPLTAVAWAANGKSLVSACEDGAVRVYTDFKAHNGKEQSEGAQMRALPATDDLLYCVAISPDGKTIYAGTHEGAVYVWNSDGKLKWKLPPQNPPLATAEAKP
jgi:WD40 repeat protein